MHGGQGVWVLLAEHAALHVQYLEKERLGLAHICPPHYTEVRGRACCSKCPGTLHPAPGAGSRGPWQRAPPLAAAIHAKQSFFAGLFGRLQARIEGKGAAWAVAHRIAKLICLIMHQGVEYQEKGSAPLHPKILQRKLARLLKEFANAGIDAQAAMVQALASQGLYQTW